MDVLLTVTLPVFGLILSGYCAARFSILGEHSSEALNAFVYYFALPALLFVFVARAPVDRIFYAPFLAAWGGGLLLTFLLGALVARFLYRDRLSDLVMRSANGFFSNTGYMGIPLVITAFGEDAALPAIMATVVLTLLGMTLMIAVIEVDLNPRESRLHVARDVAAALLKNPIVIPVLAGVLVPLLGLPLPVSLEKFCDLLGSSAGPCALFALGMFVAGQSIRVGLGDAMVIVLFKLVIHPAITFVLVYWVFTMDPLWAKVTVVESALPLGASCFVIARRFGVLVGTTSSATVLSTALSVLTLTLLLPWLAAMH